LTYPRNAPQAGLTASPRPFPLKSRNCHSEAKPKNLVFGSD
jgi:hypothetical protein